MDFLRLTDCLITGGACAFDAERQGLVDASTCEVECPACQNAKDPEGPVTAAASAVSATMAAAGLSVTLGQVKAELAEPEVAAADTRPRLLNPATGRMVLNTAANRRRIAKHQQAVAAVPLHCTDDIVAMCLTEVAHLKPNLLGLTQKSKLMSGTRILLTPAPAPPQAARAMEAAGAGAAAAPPPRGPHPAPPPHGQPPPRVPTAGANASGIESDGKRKAPTAAAATGAGASVPEQPAAKKRQIDQKQTRLEPTDDPADEMYCEPCCADARFDFSSEPSGYTTFADRSVSEDWRCLACHKIMLRPNAVKRGGYQTAYSR